MVTWFLAYVIAWPSGPRGKTSAHALCSVSQAPILISTGTLCACRSVGDVKEPVATGIEVQIYDSGIKKAVNSLSLTLPHFH